MKPKKKSTRKPLPKVWGQEPEFIVDGAPGAFCGYAIIESADGPNLQIYSPQHRTTRAALRAIRKLWRETFGGGK